MEIQTTNNSSSATKDLKLDQFQTVFIGGLGLKMDEEEILTYFRSICHIEKYKIKTRKQNKKTFLIGHMTLTTLKSDCPKLLRNPYHQVGGKRLECKPYLKGEELLKYEMNFNSRKLLIRDIPDGVSEEEFHSRFAGYGMLLNSYAVIDYKTKKPTGAGYLLYDDPATVRKILEMGEIKLKSRILKVSRPKKYMKLLKKLENIRKNKERIGKMPQKTEFELENTEKGQANIGSSGSDDISKQSRQEKAIKSSDSERSHPKTVSRPNSSNTKNTDALHSKDKNKQVNRQKGAMPIQNPYYNNQKIDLKQKKFPQAELKVESHESFRQGKIISATVEQLDRSSRQKQDLTRGRERLSFLMKLHLQPDFFPPEFHQERRCCYQRGIRSHEPEAFHSARGRFFLNKIGNEAIFINHGRRNIKLNMPARKSFK